MKRKKYSCGIYANVCQSYTNELVVLEDCITPALAIPEEIWSTIILLFIFGLNHNFKIHFYLKSLTASLRNLSDECHLPFLFFHIACKFSGVSITSLVIVTSAEHPLKVHLKFTIKLLKKILCFALLSAQKIIC